MRIAEDRGFKIIHGIVDSLWLKKDSATRDDYERLCEEIEREMHLPISFEGLYKWIVFLTSKTNANLPVLNRYYGVFEDGKMKVRGIDLRRHDTPKMIRDCQEKMRQVLAKASNSTEFHELLPSALQVLKKYVEALKLGRVRIEDLIIEKRLSKKPREYEKQTLQAIASQHLTREGLNIYAGQTVRYLIVNSGAKIAENKALPAELTHETTTYDAERYIELLLSSAANLLTPFEYDVNILKQVIDYQE